MSLFPQKSVTFLTYIKCKPHEWNARHTDLPRGNDTDGPAHARTARQRLYSAQNDCHSILCQAASTPPQARPRPTGKPIADGNAKPPRLYARHGPPQCEALHPHKALPLPHGMQAKAAGNGADSFTRGTPLPAKRLDYTSLTLLMFCSLSQ